MPETVEFVHKIVVERSKTLDTMLFAEIQSIAREYGLTERVVLKEQVVYKALSKQVPQKPIIDSNGRVQCVNGHNQPVQHYKYCPMCGQLMDWKVTADA